MYERAKVSAREGHCELWIIERGGERLIALSTDPNRIGGGAVLLTPCDAGMLAEELGRKVQEAIQ